MNYEKISALRVYLYDCEERPSDIINREKPSDIIRSAWIPQTVADQIWILYEFKTEDDRLKWENGLSLQIAKWLDRDLIPRALRFGWDA